MSTTADADRVGELHAKIRDAEESLKRLKQQLRDLAPDDRLAAASRSPTNSDESGDGWKWPLRPEEYERYGRQLIIPSVGVEGQLRLKSASVLLVGAGGLGCPAAAYIAGAGVGTIGLVDGDVVEASNLHRQIAHTTARVGSSKVDSVITYLKELNPNPTYRAHLRHLTPQNAQEIISQYDIVLDCTDHPTSRYLISDACVLLCKPLVSAAAFKTDGQLIVLNTPALARQDEAGGPCYRCIFPKPPPPSSVVSCGEGGVLGPVVGVMGVLQALETIRLVAAGVLDHSGKTSTPDYLSEEEKKTFQPSLLIFSVTPNGPSFRSVRMRGRRKDCFACSHVPPSSSAPALSLDSLKQGGVDYVRFCGVDAPVQVLKPEERISASEYASRHPSPGPDHVLLDVREREHFGVANLPGAVNVPISTLMREPSAGVKAQDVEDETGSVTSTSAGPLNGRDADGRVLPDWLPDHVPLHAPIYVVCRLGNDSQLATRKLKEMGLDRGGERFVGDIRGGMKAWKEEVDVTWPFT